MPLHPTVSNRNKYQYPFVRTERHRTLGIMEGQLSEQIDQMTQAFLWNCWETDFMESQRLGIPFIDGFYPDYST